MAGANGHIVGGMSESGGTQAHPPAWYPDPYGRHEMRFFDGTQWTEHVSSNGKQAIDPPVGLGHVPTVNRSAQKVQGDLAQAGLAPAAAPQGGGSLYSEPVLIVNQKVKLIEINNEY